METIEGYLERVTYYNDQNHFTVGRFREQGKARLVTIIGNLAGINPGESLKLMGDWVHDKKFGEQFRVEYFETIVPATINGIKKYLGSGMIRGIGPVTAERIVNHFGLQTLEIIDNNPEKMEQVEGIGPKKIALIKEAWKEHREIKNIMVFLQGHGVSATLAAKIYRRYGQSAVQVVRSNPYRLAADLRGIGFLTADQIAKQLGFDQNSVLRAAEGLLYVLSELMQTGHVYYPQNLLLEKAQEILDVEQEVVVRALEQLEKEQRIVIENDAVYLTVFHKAESVLAKNLRSLNTVASNLQHVETLPLLKWVENKLQLELAPEQKKAIELAIRNKVLVITGGPGTGKTTIIEAITKILQALNQRVLLAAPTGRAAKRINESTGFEAKTVHRLLEFNPQQGGFLRNEEQPLTADAVIVDEASMLDLLLMNSLVKALPDNAKLVLVGDIDQLPSVGPGNVLKDLMGSDEIRVVTLEQIFRQSRTSQIVLNAHRINHGLFPHIRPTGKEEETDFYFVQEENPEKASEKIMRLYQERIPQRFALDPVRDIQVLSPMHRGLVGVENLNTQLQQLCNPNSNGVQRGQQTFKVKDKVMQMVNNYEKDVFNGDIGWIANLNNEDQELIVDFDGRFVKYAFLELEELTLAYAISVHKSQGSEYPAIIMPIMTQHYMLLQRNLIYTGLTRGKRLAVILGSKKALAIAIRNNKTQERYTKLSERIKNEL